jgi:hypothetical protein
VIPVSCRNAGRPRIWARRFGVYVLLVGEGPLLHRLARHDGGTPSRAWMMDGLDAPTLMRDCALPGFLDLGADITIDARTRTQR